MICPQIVDLLLEDTRPEIGANKFDGVEFVLESRHLLCHLLNQSVARVEAHILEFGDLRGLILVRVHFLEIKYYNFLIKNLTAFINLKKFEKPKALFFIDKTFAKHNIYASNYSNNFKSFINIANIAKLLFFTKISLKIN